MINRIYMASLALAVTAATVQAAPSCPGNVDALGTERILSVDTATTPRVGRKHFPQTLAFIEGPLGSIEVCADYIIRVTTAQGTQVRRHPPPRYAWANPAYDIAHASIVDCHRHLLAALRGEAPGETTGEDNLKTSELVFAAYDSAKSGKAIQFKP